MKTKLLILFFTFFTFFINAQEYTNLTEIDYELDTPNQLRVSDDILYVATNNQILSYDITTVNPVANIIYTSPELSSGYENIIVTFNIRNGFLFIASETIDTINDSFEEINVIRVQLSLLSNIQIIETLTDYTSAITFNGSLLYRVTEDETTNLSTISYRDVNVIGSTMTALTTFNGVARDIDTYKNLVIISKIDGSIEAVNIDDNTFTLAPLNLGTTISNALGIQVLDDDQSIFIAAGNKIYEGYLFDENVNLDLYNLIENSSYLSNGVNANFNDVFVYKGVAYMTISDSGVVVKTDQISTNYDCYDTGSNFNEFASNIESPENIFISNNIMYVNLLQEIISIDLANNNQTSIYTADKIGINYEILQDLYVDNNTLYFTSRTINVDSYEIISSDLKKIDLTETNYPLTKLIHNTLGTGIIHNLTLKGDQLIYSFEDNSDANLTSIHTYNTSNNTTSNTGLSFDGYIGKMITNGDDIYYLDYDYGILKGSINSFSTNPSIFISSENTFFYPNSIFINNGELFFTDAQEILKVSLSATNPETSVETVLLNGTIAEPGGYDTTYCGYFEGGLFVNNNHIYASINGSNTIISFYGESLSNEEIIVSKENPFYLKNNILYFKDKEQQGFIYNSIGSIVSSFDSSKKPYLDLTSLKHGVYFIKTNKANFKIVI